MTEHDDRRAREAFDQLRDDAGKVDAMAAMHRVEDSSRPMFGRAVVFAAAAVLLIGAIVGGLVLNARDDRSTVVAEEPNSGTSSADRDSPGDEVDADAADFLQGSAWELLEGVGPGGTIPVVDGWPITLTFDGDNVGGRAACNNYGGTYNVAGSTLSIGDLSANAMGCEAEIAASEAAFFAALPLVDTIDVIDGQLQLRGSGVDLLFAREAPVPTSELIGTVWLLDTLIEGDAASSVQGDPATLLLDADGSVSGSTGCRTFTGSYIVTGGSVLFPDFGMQGECPAQLAEQDGLVVNVLADGFTAELDGERLTLSSVGNEGLSYLPLVEFEGECDPTICDSFGEGNIQVDLSKLLDDPPEGDVQVSAYLVDTGGGWFLCQQIDISRFARCAGRWLPIVHLDAQIVSQFGPNELTDELGSWRQSEEPVLLGGRVLEDGRFEVDGSSVSSEPSEADEALVSQFLELEVRGPDVASLPLSPDGIVMSLGIVEERLHTAAQLADPTNWSFDSEGFRGRTGMFSALDVLSNAGETEIVAGTHNHCASPPAAVPEALRAARHLSIQPVGIDSCIDWWTVGIYLDDGGDVTGIVFDTWEP